MERQRERARWQLLDKHTAVYAASCLPFPGGAPSSQPNLGRHPLCDFCPGERNSLFGRKLRPSPSLYCRCGGMTVDRVGVDGEATIMICLPSSLVTSWGGFVSIFN